VVEGGDWNVEGVNVHPSGRVVYGRNVDGWSEVTVGQLVGDRTVKPTTIPALPRGVVGELTVAADGDRTALTHSNRRSPPNVFVFETATGTATRWTDAGIEALPPESRREPEVVRYESHGAGRDGADHDGVEPGGAEDDVADPAGTDPDESDETTLDVPAFYTEPEDAAYGEIPVVVDLHGGPEQQRRPSFNPLVQYLVSRGYGVLEPNVRGSTGYGANYEELDDGRRRLDAIADVAAAVEWLRERPTVNQEDSRYSARPTAGFLALSTLTRHPEKWAAGVSIAGIADLVAFLESTAERRRSLREAEYGSLDTDRELLDDLSPSNRIDAIRAPLLLVHGENNPRIPPNVTRQLAEQAREHVPVELRVFEGEGHGITAPENRREAYRSVAGFLNEHV